jgi:hypothetical protein
MRQTKHSLFRRDRGQYFAVTTLAVVVALGLFGCEYDDSDWHLDQESGATTSRSGTKGSGANTGKAGSGGASGSASGSTTGGSAGVPASYPAPEIEAMEPATGPYGTAVTITGKGLGNDTLKGFTLAVGNQGEVELTPESDEVVSWSDEEIVFRYPFPAEGAVALEGPKGDALAGEFAPTWHIAQQLETAPAATVIASISPEPDRIIMMFDTMPLTLLDVGTDAVVEHAVTATDVETTSLRLYLNATKKVEGVGVSTGADPVIVHLQNMADDLVAMPTALKLMATEYGVAGGSEGAAVWMRRAGGWQRARPSAGVWKLDKGPIADPDPSAPDRASGTSSDGSLYVAHSVDAGSFFDDMEAPVMKRLAPTASAFGGSMSAGGAVDDYVTSLELHSSGDGLVVRVCGSDVDPFGLSGTDNYCYDSLHAPSGAQLSRVPVNAKASAHAFTHERAVAAYCSSDQSWLIRTDLDAAAAPDPSPGEIVLYPCPEAIALEVNGDGDYLPVVRYQQRTYLLERNPAAVIEPGGEGGAGGAAGAGGAGEGGAGP